MKRVIRSLIFPILFLFALGFIFITRSAISDEEQAPQTSPAGSNEFVGSEVCLTCHEDQSKSLMHTAHDSDAFRMRTDKGCEACHGPGKAHVDSGGDASLIRNPAKMASRDSAAICLTCHENGQRTHWKGSVHDMRGLACIACHSVHASKSDKALLKFVHVDEVCAGCHLEVKSQIQRTSHHPIREGLMSCNDCHNPHGTITPKLIIANSVNEQCYTCHTEKRGPFLWEHPPVRENCLNCHSPHGSNHEKLLVQNRPWLCQNCHLDTRHPGTLYDATNQLTSNREFARSCSNCHSAIHGSNHPSGRVFTR
jgi:DmsE family decaheme c-type cytochrome